MSSEVGYALLSIACLILISAFFSGSETGLTAVSRASLTEIERRGSRRASMALKLTELPERLIGALLLGNNLANNMSGGQQQRVAVARSLAMNPDLVLADEPTGNLDTKSANGVFELMREVNRSRGTSFLLVTHNLDLARRCDRIIEVVDGQIRH